MGVHYGLHDSSAGVMDFGEQLKFILNIHTYLIFASKLGLLWIDTWKLVW